MQKFENFDTEYKEIYAPEVKKDIIAFANTDGGTLYIGIKNDGTIVGVDNPDMVMLQVASSLKDSVKPDIMPFIRIQSVLEEEKHIIKIDIQVGTNRPYYLQEKGLKPSGVYVRKGTAAQPLSAEGIREMISQSSGRNYEDLRCLNQQLTFNYFEMEMKKRDLDCGSSQMRTLHLIGDDSLFTNLALLLSDQCDHTIKAAVFQGEDKTVFKDRKEFTGSLLKQLEDVFQLIDLNNKTKATFSGLTRIDTRDYPEDAIREALLNSITHRDYSFSGSTLVNIYENKIEFVSLGSLVPGISMESIFIGVSQSRNPHLAAIFYRMKLIESYGTGIEKMRRLYKNESKPPKFETAQGVFKVTLYNRTLTEKISVQSDSTEIEDTILEYLAQNKEISRKETEKLIQSGSTKSFKILKHLSETGKIKIVGKGKSTRYILA